jgi:hypothetical protein
MTDQEFLNELWINAYTNQIDGYPLGHPRRTNFKPILVTFGGAAPNRELCVNATAYTFTDEQKKILLDRS